MTIYKNELDNYFDFLVENSIHAGIQIVKEITSPCGPVLLPAFWPELFPSEPPVHGT